MMRNEIKSSNAHSTARFSPQASVIIIGRGVPSIGSEHVRVCVGRMAQGIVDDQEEDIDTDVGIVSGLFSET